MSDEEDSNSNKSGGSDDDGQESDDDESYDYGFVQDGEDDEEYEVNYDDMNVGPDILRLLGASEEIIAAKEKEISTIKWEAPKVTGLEHSSTIASFDDVALSGGKRGKTSAATNRIFKTVGSYDGPSGIGHAPPPSDSQPSHERTLTESAVFKVKISQPPEAVPKGKASKLPPAPAAGGEDDAASDTSWDEESAIDGHAWWEDLSDEETNDGLNMRVSRNLRTVLGLVDPSQGPETAEANNGWCPPSYSGLQNSKPLLTLQPVGVGRNKGIEVKRMSKSDTDGEGQESGNEGGDESEDDGWDYTDIPDEDYVLQMSTNISPNLSSALGKVKSPEQMIETLSREISWNPPKTHGLGNSTPILKMAVRS